jgi:coenzyme F420 hydrogenase subunit beta
MTVHDKTIEFAVRTNLCTGCGTCEGICPKDAIKMQIDHCKGFYIPKINVERCNMCGLCFEVCPGQNLDFKLLNQYVFAKEPDDLLGNIRQCFKGYAIDNNIRYNSSSGGLVTALLIFALEQKIIEGAIVTKMQKNNPLEPEPFIARTKEDIIEASKSKYCPVPLNIILKLVLHDNNPGKLAVVGLPCHIHGIRKAEARNKKLKDKILLHFGLACSHTDSFIETEQILNKHEIIKENVAQLDYRGYGWPGMMMVYLNDGTTKTIAYEKYIKYHELYFFTPKRCILCGDFINRFSDMSFMDAWLPEIIKDDHIGCSLIVVRNEMAQNICKKAMTEKAVQLDKISAFDIIRSQGKSRLANRDLKAQMFLSKMFRRAIPQYNMKIPQSKPINFLRALILNINIWISFNRYCRILIDPIMNIESSLFRKIKSKI